MALETPIAFCIFNRPELTRRVFGAIARQKPRRLLVVADGPRLDHPTDADRVREARSVLAQINWPCELQTNFAETNLGCRRRMASGITWAFEQAEELIILEDDCLPDDSFFAYCEELLDRYRHEPQVMMISGNNFQPQVRTNHSYYFSRYTHIWGWASWRRAWNSYDLDMKTWPHDRSSRSLAEAFEDLDEYEHWQSIFDQQASGSNRHVGFCLDVRLSETQRFNDPSRTKPCQQSWIWRRRNPHHRRAIAVGTTRVKISDAVEPSCNHRQA